MERRAAGNDSAGPSIAVGVIRRTDKLHSLAFRHLCDAPVPAFDDLTHPERKLEVFATVPARVELLSVRELPR